MRLLENIVDIAAGQARDVGLELSRLNHDAPRLDSPFGCAFEELIDLRLNQLRDSLVSALLAYRARDVLDFDELGV